MTGTTTSVHLLQRGAAKDVAVAGSTTLARPSARTPAAAAAATPVSQERKDTTPAEGSRSRDTGYKHVSNLPVAIFLSL